MAKPKKAWWWKCESCGECYPKQSEGEPLAGCRVCGDRGVKSYLGRGTTAKIIEVWWYQEGKGWGHRVKTKKAEE